MIKLPNEIDKIWQGSLDVK